MGRLGRATDPRPLISLVSPGLGVVDDDGSHATKAGVLGQRHVDHDAGGHAGVQWRLPPCSRIR